jgi:hypothetical protein
LLEALTDERTPADQPADRKDALITALTQQIEDLREQVRSERQVHAEAMSLLAVALEPIRARRPGEHRAEYGRPTPRTPSPSAACGGRRAIVVALLAIAQVPWFKGICAAAKATQRQTALDVR